MAPPVAPSVQPFILFVMEINVCQFFARLDVISLVWGDVSEHGDSHFYVTSGDGQVGIGNGDPDLLTCPTELINGILHYLRCLMLFGKNQTLLS